MKNERLIRNEDGITLIALVIIVIVLLILDGVTIATLTGENGLLNRAGEAKEKTNEAAQKEDTILTQMKTLLEDGKFSKSTTINGGERSSINPTIPAGFKAVNTETATGAVERNKANNIYDFAGNMYEWTTETGNHKTSDEDAGKSTTYAVLRGGIFVSAGNSNPASFRSGYLRQRYQHQLRRRLPCSALS